MATIQWLTHIYGCRYRRAMALEPKIEPANHSPSAVTARPASDMKMSDTSSGRKRGPVAEKWLFPRGTLDGARNRLAGAAVMLVRRYQGKPMTCWRMMRRKVTTGESSVSSSSRLTSKSKLDAYSSRFGGT